MKKYEETQNLYFSNERFKTGYDALSKGFDKPAVGYAFKREE